MQKFALVSLAAVSSLAVRLPAQVFNSGLPAGYTCNATVAATACGTSAASGSVTLAPSGGSQFGYITTAGGNFRNPLNVAGTTNGTTLTSNAFTASSGQSLSFFFNFITTDGAGFTDYAFVRLLSTTGGAPIVLFTARTTVEGNTVPGFGLPGLAPGVTLSPPTTPIIAGAPTFLGLSGCYDVGCGFTDWINAAYVIPDEGSYQLEFNIFNIDDEEFDSALAFDYALGAGGTPITPDTGVVPEPSTYALMGTGLIALALLRRRRNGADTIA